MTRPRRYAALLALPTASALALTACTSSADDPASSAAREPESGQTVVAKPQSGGDIDTLDEFMHQPIAWAPCAEADIMSTTNPVRGAVVDAYECATLLAPLNWDEPSGDVIHLAIGRHAAGEGSKGALFFNLGGPGGPARDSMASQVVNNLGQSIVDSYDIVGMDPRGVGKSTPVICMTDAERDEYNSTSEEPESEDPQVIVDFINQHMKDFGDGCIEHSGELPRYVDTVSAAKDFEMARSVLGQEKLNYLGYSYGTFLGATYAGMYPDRVGQMVLDGALDPAASIIDVSNMQMRGFEASIQHWMDVCLAGQDCPVGPTKDDAIRQVREFLEGLRDNPLPTQDPDRPLTEALGQTAVIGMLYSTETYDYLKQALTQALTQNDGSILLYLADFLNDRNDDGTYASNGTDALMAINTLDYEPVGTIDEWAADAATLKAELPVFGEYTGYASAGLAAWPVDKHAPRTPITAPGAGPIVVIGTTNDPATPYPMAESLASQLESGVLVTWDGWSHTAYSKAGNACIAGAVESYLVDGAVPAEGLRCAD